VIVAPGAVVVWVAVTVVVTGEVAVVVILAGVIVAEAVPELA